MGEKRKAQYIGIFTDTGAGHCFYVEAIGNHRCCNVIALDSFADTGMEQEIHKGSVIWNCVFYAGAG